MSSNETRNTIADALTHLKKTVLSHYRAELWDAAQAALAVVGSQSLKERGHPLALIFEGASGRGKSCVINMFEPDREETNELVYRLDKFTPASFASQAANLSKAALAEVDLLPKLQNKTLLTKELAPLFRGKDDALRENFAMLTAVLDGKGYRSAGGVHGTRGYVGSYIFNWIGGTTPIPARTDEIMAQLGNRLLRYEIIGEEFSEEALMEFAENYKSTTSEEECRKAVNDLLLEYFRLYPCNSVDPHVIELSIGMIRGLIRYATLICQGRVEVASVSVDSKSEFVSGEAEGPHRAIILLLTLARGLALIKGNGQFKEDEVLATIRHVAFSSIPQNRRKILRAVLTAGGELTSSNAVKVLTFSLPTVRQWMKELAATGIVVITAGVGSAPDTVTLAHKWSWLLADAESETEVCAVQLAESK